MKRSLPHAHTPRSAAANAPDKTALGKTALGIMARDNTARGGPRLWRILTHNLGYYMGVMTATILGSAAMSNASIAESASDLAFPMSPDSPSYWRFVSDRVMGGVSNGAMEIKSEDGVYYAQMTGDVSTANNGGFIQFRAGLSFAGQADRGASIKGVRLMTRGNNQPYYVHFRTRDSRAPWDYYAASFTASDEWQMIELPFTDFSARRGNGTKLDPTRIISMGVVAYGRDHQADISVATVEFFR